MATFYRTLCLTCVLTLPLFLCAAGCDSGSKATVASEDNSAENGNEAESAETNATEASTESTAKADPPVEATNSIEPLQAIELNAEKLLASALSKEELQEGWIRLFDGQSPFGWFVAGKANWKFEDEIISVSRGDKSFLCTSFQLADYELKLEFRSDPNTNSGVFLRTGPQPDDVAESCLELNIAPPDNPFPTASFVARHKVETSSLGEFDPTEWHTYHVRLVGDTVVVKLDGKEVVSLEGQMTDPTGHISLQHNEGKVEFRNILLRPIVDGTSLKLDDNWQEDWEKGEKEGATLTVTPVDSGLQMEGGLGKLQSKNSYGDFVLHAEYSLANPDVNSGIFFRCMPEAMLDGYECQVNHSIVDGDPLIPGDGGAGAIFRRQNARVVVGDGTSHNHITLLANGPQILTWVNGVQVVDFYDDREPNENPRRGLRLEPGPIALQGHDPGTKVIYHKIEVAQLNAD